MQRVRAAARLTKFLCQSAFTDGHGTHPIVRTWDKKGNWSLNRAFCFH